MSERGIMLVLLSRLQFAVTIMFHFLFVPLSIGMILLVAIFETLHVVKKDDKYRKLGDFFGNVFIVQYAIGIVTGITMSLQFGTNWANYSTFMGDVFGAPLAMEALLAFFLESTFTGVWIFARHQITPKFRMITAWLIWFGTSISALWIITANGFMQHPVGYELAADKSHVILTNIWAVLLNPYAWYMLIHTVTAAYLLGAMMVMSISAAKLLSKKVSERDKEFFRSALKVSGISGLVASILVPIIGMSYFSYIGNPDVQPSKVDAINGGVPFVTIAFLLMVSVGTLMILLSLFVVAYKDKIIENDSLKRIYKWVFILPYIGINAGWIVTEVGRQPWVVYGLLKTSEGVSEVPTSEVGFSIAMTVLLYTIIGMAVVYFTLVQIAKPIDSSTYKSNKKYLDSTEVGDQ